jgi:hypothetical protein
MLRFAEIGLFLLPFALYGAWRVLGARATVGLIWATAAVVAVLAATIIWYGMENSLPAGTHYVPAQLHDGKIVSGHGS